MHAAAASNDSVMITLLWLFVFERFGLQAVEEIVGSCVWHPFAYFVEVKITFHIGYSFEVMYSIIFSFARWKFVFAAAAVESTTFAMSL